MFMNGIKEVRLNRQGSVLVVVMAILFITAGLVITILDVASDHRKISTRQLNMEQAMYVAEAGVERGARLMESNLAVIVSSSTGRTNGSGTVGSGTYSFYITRTNTSTYCIISTGTVSGVSRVVSLMDVYQPTYAEFALWSATNGAIYFVNGETFNGHVHANDKLYFDVSGGGPTFYSPVTSDAGTYSVTGGSISGVTFDQGFTLNSYQGTMADVDFNSSASTSLKNEATSTGQLLQGSTTITFNSGTMTISNDRQGWTNHVYTPAAEGIIYVATATTGTSATRAGTVMLNGGTISGRMTIASEDDITIDGNISYKTNPTTTPTSTDALGLISYADITVGTSAPNNLTIDAAMMATGASSASSTPGTFSVLNYNTGSSRGVLTVYGGIVQEVRGAVGTGSGSSGTGYTKSYSYDPRFITKPPPYYPTISSQVLFSQWSESH
jgi:hypothetical protein